MSSLTAADKLYLEKVLGMSSGVVLHFSDATYGQFFSRHGVDIHGTEYQIFGTSKAKKMRAFWEKEPDALVAQILSELLATYEAFCHSNGVETDAVSLLKSQEIVARLASDSNDLGMNPDEEFLGKEFEIPNVQNLPVSFAVSEIIQDRLNEAQLCLSQGANLSVIFLCGSILEAVLLGAAQNNPEEFNRSHMSPRKDGKVRAFHDWSLSDFINVANNVGLLQPDVQKFGHGLRDFRNYIHPYQQMASGFNPDVHTAKICFQVLKAALADVAGERP